MKTKIISGFPGTGKSHICQVYGDLATEIECWEYSKESDFPSNIVKDIKSAIGKFEYIFISTNPVVLDALISEGIDFSLYYPTTDQKEDYMRRYKERKSPYDFIGVMYVHWDDWLKECHKFGGIILKRNEFISSKIFNN